MLRFTDVEGVTLIESTWSADWVVGLGLVLYLLLARFRIQTDSRLELVWAWRLTLTVSGLAFFGGWALERLVWNLPLVEQFGAPSWALGWSLIVGVIVGTRAAPFFEIDTRQIGDALAPAVLIGAAVARLGCVIGGCDFGLPGDGEWAVRYPPATDPFRWAAENGLLEENDTRGPASHPFAVYQSLSLAAVGLFVALFPRDLVRPGLISAIAAFGTAATIGVTESWRAGGAHLVLGPVSLPIMQVLSGLAALGALLVLARIAGEREEEEKPEQPPESPFVT